MRVPRGLVGYRLRGRVPMFRELRLYALMEAGEKEDNDTRAAGRQDPQHTVSPVIQHK